MGREVNRFRRMARPVAPPGAMSMLSIKQWRATDCKKDVYKRQALLRAAAHFLVVHYAENGNALLALAL